MSPLTQVAAPDGRELIARTRRIATEVAAKYAADVDAKARFPTETFAALREARILSALVPVELGGSGASMRDLVEMCMILGQSCGSSAMVLAMHHIQVACVVRHARSSAFFEGYLRELVEKQILMASITSEVGIGGDTRSSICAIERANGRFRLVKDATTVSYGAEAEDLLVTCRRAADAAPSDQILVLVRPENYKLTLKGKWDTLGMRGTCSPPFEIESEGPEEQIIPGSFADSSAESMVPYSHILWSALWTGIATDAVNRAAAYVRAAARKKPGTIPPTATRLAEVSVMLQAMRSNVTAAAADFDALNDDREALGTMAWALRFNNLKIGSSEAAPAIVHKALQIIGIMGYKNDSPFSVGRHYRDTLSGALMVGNERILAKSASMLLVAKGEQG
ncbi:MAG: acyl-CoA dehydrogenase family protein [Gemmatimonadales bacterium]